MKLKKISRLGPRGGCIVSKNILYGHEIRWCVRNEPCNPKDTGWLFMSEIDTEEFFEDPSNCIVVSWDLVAKIEPAVEKIYNCPIGADLVIVKEDGEVHFYDEPTGLKVF